MGQYYWCCNAYFLSLHGECSLYRLRYIRRLIVVDFTANKTQRRDLPDINTLLSEMEAYDFLFHFIHSYELKYYRMGPLRKSTSMAFKSLSEANLRMPLYLALGVSPLVLLVPTQWMRKPLPPPVVMQVCHYFVSQYVYLNDSSGGRY